MSNNQEWGDKIIITDVDEQTIKVSGAMQEAIRTVAEQNIYRSLMRQYYPKRKKFLQKLGDKLISWGVSIGGSYDY